MKNRMFNIAALGFIASTSTMMAAFLPVANVATTLVPGSAGPPVVNPQYLLQSITVGTDVFAVANLATGKSSASGSASNIGLIDDYDLNTLSSGWTYPLNTVYFGGTTFVDTNGTLPDFFLFEAGADPDDVAITPVFPDDSLGTAVNLPGTFGAAGWGDTLLDMSGQQNGQSITGISWDITDMKDINGVNLTSSSVIQGIRITQVVGGIDPTGFFAAVPEPSSMAIALLGLGGLALRRKRA